MTAEVAVLNRLGVALASDSAASVCINKRTKLYHADKLFMLSNCQPVGVMVNNNSTLANVPWETIIKRFREHLGTRALDRLEDYATAFFGFIDAERTMFPREAQQDFILETLREFMGSLKEVAFDIGMEKHGLKKGKSDGYYIELGLDEALARTVAEWRRRPDHPKMVEKNHGVNVITGMSERVRLNAMPFEYEATRARLVLINELARLFVLKEGVLPHVASNLVIAGFGDKDYFPTLQEFEIAGVFGDVVKYREARPVLRISGNENAAIRTFAQTEVAENFLYGLSMQVHTSMMKNLNAFLIKQAGALIDSFPGSTKAKKQAYKELSMPIMQNNLIKLFDEFVKQRDERYYDPIIQSIAHLPKNELAQVAATLVSLSSFQKRVSMYEDETVGGPIDVAVITRGDGFVWVERKHYFKPELNPHYFVNRRVKSEQLPQAGMLLADNKDVPVPDSSSEGATQ